MDEHTNKVTLDELAGMIQRSVAHKTDLDLQRFALERFIENENAKLAALIAKIPTRDELDALLRLHERVAALERDLRGIKSRG